MANSSSGSAQGQRRPHVGLPLPRAARGRANDEEVSRRAIQDIARRGHLSLDIASSDAETENMSSDSSDASTLGEQRGQALGNSDASDLSDSPPNSLEQRRPADAPRAAANLAARNRYFWTGNDAKLNLMASKYLNQPLRQEIIANASRNQEAIAHIRSLKRIQTQDLDHDNLKHSGKLFLVQKTCERLNACETFKEHMPPNQTLTDELCRQKIKEFQRIAVNTSQENIDQRARIQSFYFTFSFTHLFRS